MYDCIDFVLWRQCEALEDLVLESAAWWQGLGLRPIHTGDAPLIVPAVCVFPAVDNDPAVQE